MAIEEIRRKNGKTSYRAVVRIFRKKVSKSFRRKIDAEHWEQEKRVERNQSNCQMVTRMTLNEFFARFRSDYMEPRLAASTKIMAEGMFRNHIEPHLGEEGLQDLDTRKLRTFLFFLSIDRHATNERVNRVRRLLHSMFNRAVEWELIAKNPITPIKQLPSKRHLGDENVNFLSQLEVARILDWARVNDEWLYPKIMILVNTGMRYGEMAALHVGDFRRSSGSSVLVVSRTYCRLSYQLKDRTKVNRSRIIPMGEGMERLLTSLVQGRSPADRLLWADWNEGKHQTKFNKHFHRALQVTGVRRVRVHDLRHTFAVHFLENGGQLFDLQKILGHHSIQLTEKYSHFSMAMSERSRGLVDHHGNPRVLHPRLTVVDGGPRREMSHKCPTASEEPVPNSFPVTH